MARKIFVTKLLSPSVATEKCSIRFNQKFEKKKIIIKSYLYCIVKQCYVSDALEIFRTFNIQAMFNF